MQTFDFSEFFIIHWPWWRYVAGWVSLALFFIFFVTFLLLIARLVRDASWFNNDEILEYRVKLGVMALAGILASLLPTSLMTSIMTYGDTQYLKSHNDNNFATFPATTLIARNNPDEYTIQNRHTKPVVFKSQDGHTKQASLVNVSAEQISDDGNDEKTSTPAYFKRNGIVKLPLDKADEIQTGDRVTTTKQTLHVNYTGKKAFKLHVTKIERPVSADKTQWHTVYEAK